VTNKVVIAMDEPCSSTAPKEITVVLTVDRQTVRFSAKRDDSSGTWVGKRPDGLTFPADRAKASLRLKRSRTGCEQSFAADNEDAAKFLFHCNQRGVRSVMISTDGSVGVTYTRKNAGCKEETEQAYFESGSTPYPVGAMWVPGEEFSLRLVSDMQSPPGPGLIVFALDQAANVWPLFSPDPKNSGVLVCDVGGHRRRKKTGEALTLKRREIADIFLKQHFPHGWQLRGSASDVEDERLKKAGLMAVTFKVQ
jgi:hypothetical protein